MKAAVSRHGEVPHDIEAIAIQLAEDSVMTALRFVRAVEETVRGLSEFPGKGGLKEYSQPQLANLRTYSVNGFRNHLVVYRIESPDHIRILAILHGMRNLPNLLSRRV